jgi:gluconokinase
MKSDMVKSQYDIMEIPNGDELVANGGECLAVDTTNKTPEEILQEILNQIN